MTAGCELHLDAALTDFRRRIERRRRGRVVCTVEILEGVVVEHRIEEMALTSADVEREMRCRPWKRGAR